MGIVLSGEEEWEGEEELEGDKGVSKDTGFMAVSFCCAQGDSRIDLLEQVGCGS
jgi:hypothetical protein